MRTPLALALSALTLFATTLSACGGVPIAGPPDDPEVVVLEGELANAYVMAGEGSEIVSRLRIETSALRNVNRPPINLSLVIDTSGSMDGAPISDARQASLELLSVLHPEDRLSIVVFHSETEVLMPSTLLSGADLGAVRAAISEMEARGTTDLGGGMQAGLEELVRNYEPEGINRLVLLSDGVPNDASPVLPLAQAAGERGIRITALGLGLDYDETLLGQVAQQSGGRFHYVAESSAVADVFRDEVLRFERLLARNVQLELRPGPGVVIESVVGQATSNTPPVVRVALGDLSEGERRDVIVRLRADRRRAGAAVELLDAVLVFEDAVVDAGRLERRVFLGARATADVAEIEAGRNAEVERAAARMLVAATTVTAIERAREGNIEEARQILNAAAASAPVDGDDGLAQQVSQMRVLGEALPSMSASAGAAVNYGGGGESYEEAAGAEAPQPAPAPMEDSAGVIRRAHDSAMQVLQSAP